MQGGTVERAIAVASPRDLTAGWSYTALSRARGETRVLIIDADENERSEFAPSGSAVARDPCLTRVARRMLERDDEDLAVECLPGYEHPEQSAERAEPGITRRARQRLEDLEARISTLRREQGRIAVRLGGSPRPDDVFGRKRDPDSIERVHLAVAVKRVARHLRTALDEHGHLARALEDASRVTFEREFEQALRDIKRHHACIDAMSGEHRVEPSRTPESVCELDRGIER